MDILWGDEKTANFVSHIGLITTDGSHGPDIMACEWTQQISYRPALFAIYVGPNKATYDNILATKEFGLHIAAHDQSVLTSIAGGQTGRKIDKIRALTELGYRFRKAETLSVPMLEGAAFWAECVLIDHRTYGDHEMFIGEAKVAEVDREKVPLLYHSGKYWHRGEQIQKPPAEELEKIAAIIQKAKK